MEILTEIIRAGRLANSNWNADTYTRIVIDVGSKVNYQAARISGPDRIYF